MNNASHASARLDLGRWLVATIVGVATALFMVRTWRTHGWPLSRAAAIGTMIVIVMTIGNWRILRNQPRIFFIFVVAAVAAAAAAEWVYNAM